MKFEDRVWDLMGERERLQQEAMAHNVPFIDLDRIKIKPEVAALVPRQVALDHGVIPIKSEGDVLWLAMADFQDHDALKAVRDSTRLKVRPVAATRADVEAFLMKLYSE